MKKRKAKRLRGDSGMTKSDKRLVNTSIALSVVTLAALAYGAYKIVPIYNDYFEIRDRFVKLVAALNLSEQQALGTVGAIGQIGMGLGQLNKNLKIF